MFNRFTFKNTIPLKNIPYAHTIKFPTRLISNGIVPAKVPLEFKEKLNLSIECMTRQDLSLVIEWTKQEHWNPGVHELDALWAADPKGFYMLRVKGKPIASLAAVRYSKSLATLGMYIVLPEFRGKGYGKLLWDAAMGHIKDCASIGLNAVMDQIQTYTKSGFSHAFLNTRWKSKSTDIRLDRQVFSPSLALTTRFSLESAINYDASIFSVRRGAFLTRWLQMPESFALGAINSLGDLCGLAVISNTAEGYKIAPLYANTQDIATELYQAVCRNVEPDARIFLDTCATNPLAQRLITQFQHDKVFDTMTMFSGTIPNQDHNKVFGKMSLEIS